MNDVDSAQLDRFLRHAEDYALGFIQGDGLGPGVFHFQQSARTIVPISVRITPTTFWPAYRAAERNKTSTEGL
jgi:hypothetical protein